LLILYMSDGELTSLAEERLVSLTTCEALIWLNRVMKSGLFGIDSLGRGPLMGPACVETRVLGMQARHGEARSAQARIASIKPPTPRMLITLFIL
jgi:hypothetical protein